MSPLTYIAIALCIVAVLVVFGPMAWGALYDRARHAAPEPDDEHATDYDKRG